jgi:ABC-type nitrate/sulfonate/bicarbonate transport system substrate-binding protein
MKGKIGWIVLAFCGVISVLLLVGGAAEAQRGDLELKKIAVHFQTNPPFAPVSVALEKGWFKEAGFESAMVKSFSSGHLAGEALMSGDLHVWLPGNMPVISMKHNGLPIVVIGNLNICPAEFLMVRNDAGVTKPADLYRIKIGLSQGSTASGVIDELARHNGLDVKKLQLVNLAPPEQVTALKNNEIQAMLSWPPNTFQVKDIATYKFDSLKFSHTRIPIVVTEEFIRKYPNTTKAILKVLYRGQAFIIDKANWPEAMQLHAKRAETPLKLVEDMWLVNWDLSRDHGSVNQKFVDDFDVYTQFQLRNGMIKSAIPVLDYTFTGYLKEIDPNYVKIEGKWKR